MPTYDYKCNSCSSPFVAIHSIKDKAKGCPLCCSEQVVKTVSPFAAKTETRVEHRLREHQQQGVKGVKRFHKDDKFAANITGADDPNHQTKLSKVIDETRKKNEIARKKLKRVNNE